MKIKLPWSKPADTYTSKMEEAGKLAEEMADKNTAWFDKTGQEPEQRPGFREENARVHKLLQEADFIRRNEKAIRMDERARVNARMEKLDEESKEIADSSGHTEWKNKRGLK